MLKSEITGYRDITTIYHRGLFVDLPRYALLQNLILDISLSNTRILKSNYPRLARLYKAYQKKEITKREIIKK